MKDTMPEILPVEKRGFDKVQTLFYPRRNRIGVEPIWIERRLSKIQKIDLVEHPLPIRDYISRPLVRRGRWLIRAWDLDARKYRQFYACAFRHQFREPPLRIGMLNDQNRLMPISREYIATVEDRRTLAVVLMRMKDKSNVWIYADDLELVKTA